MLKSNFIQNIYKKIFEYFYPPIYLNIADVHQINLEYLIPLAFDRDAGHLKDPAGLEHYKLLGWFSTKFNNATLVEIGTRHGTSALALSHNPTNKVISYDIYAQLDNPLVNTRENIEFRVEDVWVTGLDKLKSADLIFVDIDPHNGQKELELFNYLKAAKYKGIFLLDDVSNYWPDLKIATELMIHDKKFDITKYGHFSGTLLIDFSNRMVIESI